MGSGRVVSMRSTRLRERVWARDGLFWKMGCLAGRDHPSRRTGVVVIDQRTRAFPGRPRSPVTMDSQVCALRDWV